MATKKDESPEDEFFWEERIVDAVDFDDEEIRNARNIDDFRKIVVKKYMKGHLKTHPEELENKFWDQVGTSDQFDQWVLWAETESKTNKQRQRNRKVYKTLTVDTDLSDFGIGRGISKLQLKKGEMLYYPVKNKKGKTLWKELYTGQFIKEPRSGVEFIPKRYRKVD